MKMYSRGLAAAILGLFAGHAAPAFQGMPITALAPAGRLYSGQPRRRLRQSSTRTGYGACSKHVHENVRVTSRIPSHWALDPVDRFGLISNTEQEINRPKRRAERKGINTVPRAPVNSLHAISFSR